MRWWLTVSLIVIIAISTSYGAQPIQVNVQPNSPGGFSARWTVPPQNQQRPQDPFTMTVSGQTRGWLGIGFSPSGAMSGSDIVVMWLDANGRPQISDRHGPTGTANGFPPVDQQQDYKVLSGSDNGTHLTFTIQRAIDTCDPNDWKIGTDTVRMLFAANDQRPTSANDIQEHTRTAIQSTRFLAQESTSTAQQLFQQYGTAKIDMSQGGVPIPGNEDTLYYCKLFTVPTYKEKMTFIGFEALIDNHEHAHHMVLFSCKNDPALDVLINQPSNCFVGTGNNMSELCTTQIAVWAVGGGPFAYPSNMSMRWDNSTKYMMVQMHYDNSKFQQGATDNSTMRLWLSNKPRPIEMGKLVLGSVTEPYYLVVPPGASNFTHRSLCTSNMTKRFPSKITVTSAMLHSHLAGRKIRVRHIRNGAELPPIFDDPHYDFNYQSIITRFDNPVVIMPGDDLVLECTYDASDRSQPVLGGESTHNEMCITYLDHYPPLSDKSGDMCMGQIAAADMIKMLGGGNGKIDDSDHFAPTIIDSSGRNVTYESWINSLPWNTTKSLAQKLQNFILTQPQFGYGTFGNPNTMGGIFTSNLTMPKITKPLNTVDSYCAAKHG